jgi:hypothetical protein
MVLMVHQCVKCGGEKVKTCYLLPRLSVLLFTSQNIIFHNLNLKWHECLFIYLCKRISHFIFTCYTLSLHLSCKIQKTTKMSRLNLEKGGVVECCSSDEKKDNKMVRGTQIVISIHVEGTPKFWAPDVCHETSYILSIHR